MEKENTHETKSSQVEILKGAPDDAEGIQTLVGEASKGMYKLCGWSEKDIEDHFNPETIKNGVDKLKGAIATFTESDILFVAKDTEGKIVGCCFAEKQEDKNKIEAVYILPDFQGLGLSKKLFDDTFKQLNPNNDTFLDVFSLNSKAINFYKKLGFTETGNKSNDQKYANTKGEPLEITEMILPGAKTRG